MLSFVAVDALVKDRRTELLALATAGGARRQRRGSSWSFRLAAAWSRVTATGRRRADRVSVGGASARPTGVAARWS